MTYGPGSLGQAGEAGVLREVFAALGDPVSPDVLVGPGDDTALLRVRRGAVLATTDTMVRGRDWLDEWSSATDVGIKVVTQNLADLASMGGVGTGLLVSLVADPGLPLAWARELTAAIGGAAGRSGVPVLGGDLSSAPSGVVMVSVTALGELGDGVTRPVLRSGARAGDLLAVSGQLGRSGTGWLLLRQGVLSARSDPEAVALEHHRRPLTDLQRGPEAARAGATAMLDISDGLVRDADRLARASLVRLELDDDALRSMATALVPAADLADAMTQVLSGGEEHELLATFPPGCVPDGWTVIGRTVDADAVDADARQGPGVWLDGDKLDPAQGGWDHFGG